MFKYIGETNRSTFERGHEHLADMKYFKPGSHILKHIVDKHEGEDMEKIDIRMKVVKFHKSSFERQIHESVLIQSNRNHWLLNSKAEFNRCAIPRLGLKLGDKEFREKNKELIEEEKREAELEEKIRNLKKKQRGKREPRRPPKSQPARKKQKMNDNGEEDTEVKGLEEKG